MARTILGGTVSFALLGAAPRSAHADTPSANEPNEPAANVACVRVEVAPGLARPWSDAVRELTRELEAMRAADCRPMTLSIAPAGDAATIVATDADGRQTERGVREPSMLVPIALGLAISIPRDAAPDDGRHDPRPPTPPGPPPAVPRDTIEGDGGPASAPPPPANPPPVPHSTEVRLGVALGPRFGVPSTISMVEIEGRADLRVDRLLVFASFENVPVGFVAGQGFDADAYRESSIAIGLGRNLPVGRYALDIAAAPSIVTMRLDRDGPDHARADDVELRIGVSVRLDMPLSKSWNFTVTADTDLIPDAIRTANRIDPLPAFPAWTTGLRLGATGLLL